MTDTPTNGKKRNGHITAITSGAGGVGVVLYMIFSEVESLNTKMDDYIRTQSLQTQRIEMLLKDNQRIHDYKIEEILRECR